MVALARIVLAKRERVVMLQSWDKGLLGTTLRYPYEVRDSEDYFDDIPEMKLPKDMLQLAEHILETKAGDFEPEKFEDRYENAVVEMIQRKRSGMPVPTERIAASPPNVVSLMDALKRSLAAEEAKTPQAATKAKKPKKAAAGQREIAARLFVDREVAHRGAVLGRHVGDGGAVGHRQRRAAFAEELDELANYFGFS